MRFIHKWLLYIALLAASTPTCYGQVKTDTAALQNAIKHHPQPDTVRVNLLNKAGFLLYRNRAIEAYGYYSEAFTLAKKLNYNKGEAASALGLGFYHRFRGEHAIALIYTKRAEQLYIKLRDTLNQIACQYNLINIYRLQNDLLQSITVNLDALKLAQGGHSDKWLILLNNLIGQTFLRMGDPEKASNYINTALKVAIRKHDLDGMQHCYNGLGDICQSKQQWQKAKGYYERSALINIKTNNMQSYNEAMLSIGETKIKLGNYDSVLLTVYQALKNVKKIQDYGDIPFAHSVLASAYLGLGHADSAVKYGLLSLQAQQVRGEKFSISSSSEVLAKAYAALGNYKEAYHYHVLSANYRDSVNQNQNLHRLDVIQYTNDLDKKQSQIMLLKSNTELISKESRQQKILLIFVIAGLLAAAVFSFILLRSNKQKQLANKLLKQQQDELKATQTQLIQSEKMASLGELTAGIAHEIQNPLNFVNNFSEVTMELVDEMKEELDKGDKEEAIAIAADIKQNLEKIRHHGKRADGIVKGMLQHSRASSNTKELTDINKLADEYLRLAYHGLRAKDKAFNAELVTNFAPNLPLIDMVPQDIGRVMLNLFTNAFYATQQKKGTAGGEYKPEVTVSTKTEKGQLVIKVKDNGVGMPEHVKEKIMQPFFTTKPTGEGTGLGLSLSYDIVVKGHGGIIEVNSVDGEGSEFIIKLPL